MTKDTREAKRIGIRSRAMKKAETWRAGSLLIQCSIFCMVIVIVGESPAVLLYETQ